MTPWRHILRTTSHRPYPLPCRPWAGVMRWESLLFMHWPIAPAVLADHLPAGMELDRFEGDGWISIVPFRMSNTRPRFLPPIPGLSRFLELNVRTYVTVNGVPGVWFFSLDAASRVAVRGARRWFHLPYYDARMRLNRDGEGWIHYASSRTHRGAPAAELKMSYRPTGAAQQASPGTLDHFLAERYCLYSADRRGRVYRADVHHLPWLIQPAEARINLNTMTTAAGIALPDTQPVLHYSESLDVVVWWVKGVTR